MSAVLKEKGLSDQEHADFIIAIKTLLAIETTDQLLQWTQSELQALLPHEIFIFGVGRISKDSIEIGRMFSSGFPAGYVSDIRRSDGEVMSPIMTRWCRENKPQLFEPEHAPADIPAAWLAIFQKHKLRNMAAHGMRDLSSNVASYFNFSRIPVKLTPHHAYLLELLVPHMHVALVKVLSQIKPAQQRSTTSSLKLSTREKGILQWLRAGKSNWEVSQILGLSEYTVKNQVHGILVKLRVKNRAQAVAKAISMEIIRSSR